jgi:hypothetical protein
VLLLSGLLPNTVYYFQATSTDAAGNVGKSEILTFKTNPSGVINPIIIDNTEAIFSGNWTTGSSSPDKFGADYRFKGQGTGASYAEYIPNIPRSGTYQVYVWHPQGSNRTLGAPFVVKGSGGSISTVLVNQQVNGGGWRLLGEFKFLAGPDSSSVKITDAFSDGGKVVIADAVQFVYVPPLQAPIITRQPAGQVVIEGASVQFTVEAAGTGELSYQWKKDGQAIAGATTQNLSLNSVTPAMEGEYSVEVRNAAGAVESQAASLIVLQKPLIVTSPVSRTVQAGQAIRLEVIASGSEPFQYQWFRGATRLEGETSSVLEISSAAAADSGEYHAEVSNPAGQALSSPATVSIVDSIQAEITRVEATASGKLRLEIKAVPGAKYVIESSPDLETWSPLAEFTAADDEFAVEPEFQGSAMFYRVVAR